MARSNADQATDGRGRRNGNGAMYRQQHSKQLILKTIIEIISTMSDDSDMQRGPAARWRRTPARGTPQDCHRHR
jgi:hypothetical protein